MILPGHRTLSEMLRERFGTKVYKLSLSSGCTCPNRDGTIGYGGCIFCSGGGSGEFAAPCLPVREQIRLARQKVDAKFPKSIPPSERRYIAYFQSFTNTYGNPERLRALYEETIRQPEIVALSIGTRPDCLPDEILDMLARINEKQITEKHANKKHANEKHATEKFANEKHANEKHANEKQVDEELKNETSVSTSVSDYNGNNDRVIEGDSGENKPVWIELGLQTIHERTAERIHRGYSLPVFEDAWQRLKGRGLEGILHVILGLPGETRTDMLETMRYIAELNPLPDGIKLQQLQILRGTALEQEYLREPFPVMTLDEYCGLIQECLAILPPQIVIHRLTGDGPKSLLIAPSWSADKKRVLNTMQHILA